MSEPSMRWARGVRLGLTPKQATIAELLCDGATIEQAAQALGVNYKTIKWHLTLVYRHFGIPKEDAHAHGRRLIKSKLEGA